MSDQLRRVATAEERERFNAAREHGGLCAACGRSLAPDEPVYIDQVVVDRNALAPPGARWGVRLVPRDAPLGVECVPAELLVRLEGRTPERCAGCGRPVYYAKDRAQRRRATCSDACRNRADRAARRGPLPEGEW